MTEMNGGHPRWVNPDGIADDDANRDEAARLAALHRYNILDTPAEEGFERITRLAKALLDAPIVAITMIDNDRQWLKSSIGFGASETRREDSFCTHTIRSEHPLIVTDAAADPVFVQNPYVSAAPNIRFYLGVPLRTPDGFNIGSICAMDQVPRTPEPQQVALLQDLAGLVMTELELRQIADTDSLTGLMTRRSLLRDTRRALAQATRTASPLCCLLVDVDHFKSVNDRHGHAAGDMALRMVAATLRSCLRSMDLLGRIGGEEFAIILPDTLVEGAVVTARRILAAMAECVVVAPSGPIKLTVSVGVSASDGRNITLETLLAEADVALYTAKSSGRNRVEIAQEAQTPEGLETLAGDLLS